MCAIFVTCFASLATLAAENLPLERIKLPPDDTAGAIYRITYRR